MTALIITAAVLAFLALIVLLPVRLRLKYDGDFTVKVYYAGIKFFDSDKQKSPSHKKKKEKKPKEEKPKKQLFIARDWENMTKTEFIKYYVAVLKDVLEKVLYLVKKLRFRLLEVTVGVAAGDAFETAVQYGAVCAAVNPVFSLLNTYTKIKTRRINIYSDFVTDEYRIAADVNVRVRVIYLLISGVKLIKIYDALSDGTYKPKTEKSNETSNENTKKESVKKNERAK